MLWTELDDCLWYSGRASQLGGTPIINLLDWQQCSLSRCQHPLCQAKLITHFNDWHVQKLGQSFTGKNHYFWRYPKFLLSTVYNRWKEAPVPKTSSIIHSAIFDRISTCNRHRHMFSMMYYGLQALWVSTTMSNSITFINIISQHLSVKHTLQQLADYVNMHKTLLSTSTFHS